MEGYVYVNQVMIMEFIKVLPILLIIIGFILMCLPKKYLVVIAKHDVCTGGYFYRKSGPQAAVQFYRIFGATLILGAVVLFILFSIAF